MASNNYSLVDIEKDSDELQFQDFELNNSGSRATNSQTHYFTNFPDSPGHQTDSQKKSSSPCLKRCRYDKDPPTGIAGFLPLDQPCSHNVLTNFGDASKKFNFTEGTVSEVSPVIVESVTKGPSEMNSKLHSPKTQDKIDVVESPFQKRDELLLCSKHASVQAILPDNVKSAADLTPALVLRVCKKQLVSKAVKNLSSCWPVAELQHLKRVFRIPGQLSTVLDIETRVQHFMTPSEVYGKVELSFHTATLSSSKTKVDDTEKSEACGKRTTSANSDEAPVRDSMHVNEPSCTGQIAKSMTTKEVATGDAFFLYVDLMSTLAPEEWDMDKNLRTFDSSELTSKVELFVENLDVRLPKPILSRDLCCKVHEKLAKKGVDLSLFSSSLYIGWVSRHAPRLRHQFEAVTASWPCTFHEDDHLAKLIEGKIFNDDETQTIIANMNRALALTQRKLDANVKTGTDEFVSESYYNRKGNMPVHNDSCVSESASHFCTANSSALEMSARSNSSGVGCSSCIMTQNLSDRVVVQTVDKRDKHPLAHAAMMAVDRVAQTLGGGAWSSLHEDDHGCNIESKQRSTSTISCENELQKISNKCVSSSGPTSSSSLSKFSSPALNEGSSASMAFGNAEKDSSANSYICTGLDVYLSHEPCMMCAMALLHSRVSRVFYCQSNTKKGALGSVVKLHTLPNINHRYEVFSVAPVDCHCLYKERDS